MCSRALGVAARVLPMCDAPVRTRVRTAAGQRGLQEYLIVDRGEPEVLGVELEGIGDAEASPEVVEALSRAEAIVIGPSNPVISIGPILAVPGVREAIADSEAPVVAVSPFVAGKVVKGPTHRFMAAVGRPSTAAGVASLPVGGESHALSVGMATSGSPAVFGNRVLRHASSHGIAKYRWLPHS